MFGNSLTIREEYLILTDDYLSAILLDYFVKESQTALKFDMYLSDEIDRIKTYGCYDKNIPYESAMDKNYYYPKAYKDLITDGWVFKTIDNIVSECMIKASAVAIRKAINNLINRGYLWRETSKRYTMLRTYQYKVNFEKLETELKNLTDL